MPKRKRSQQYQGKWRCMNVSNILKGDTRALTKALEVGRKEEREVEDDPNRSQNYESKESQGM